LLDELVRTPARRALPVLLLAIAPAVQAQQTPPTAATQQREHLVKERDTLWDLARFYLGNPFLWPMIYEANRNVVENPHRIFPAERLIIPALQPEPAGEPIGSELPEKPAAPEMPADEITGAKDTTVAATVDLRRPIVPLMEYRGTPWLSATAERETFGRVMRLADPSADEDRLPTTLHPQARVHLGSLRGSATIGDSLLVVRFGRGISGYGRIVEPLAILQVDSVTPTVVSARVVRQFGDAKVGDVVLPLGAAPEIGLGSPEPVEGGQEGNLLDFLVTEPMHSTADLAFITVGSAQGLRIGDELAVYVPSRSVDNERAERLPPQEVAVVRVLRTDERSSTVRVLSINSAALRSGLPVRVVRRMP